MGQPPVNEPKITKRRRTDRARIGRARLEMDRSVLALRSHRHRPGGSCLPDLGSLLLSALKLWRLANGVDVEDFLNAFGHSVRGARRKSAAAQIPNRRPLKFDP